MSSPQFARPKSEDDPLLSPIFLSSADDVTSTSSSSNSSSHESGSPRNDWILPSNININARTANPPLLWSNPGTLNHFSLSYSSPDHWAAMGFDSDLPSFLPDTSHQFSIDPNALHFGGGCEPNPNEQESLVAGCDPVSFPFSLSPPLSNQFSSPMSSEMCLDVSSVHHIPTPMSVSVVSSLSRSPSPLYTPAYGQSLQDTGINPNELSLISQRAREAAGVTLAIPVNSNTNAQPLATTTVMTQVQTSELPLAFVSHDTAAPHTPASPKIAIPRVKLSQQFGLLSSSQAVNTSPSVGQNDMVIIHDTQSQPHHTTKAGRPKTSHTTIERRYRTNLNARILALRRAVPALRILEKNIPHSGITQGKGLTGATAPKAEFHDIVNERGYVDGVKAAKKNSKGVVLGKAVEYIKALKRREIRLRRETDGLKALLLGLVGGPELLVEWDKEWRAKFGGEEMDEIEEDADMDGDCDDGGEGDDDEDDEVDEDDADSSRKGRPRKRNKPDPVPSVKLGDKKPLTTAVSAPQTGEKRKRGRPRKIQTPPTNVGVPKLVLHPPSAASIGMPQNQPEPPKYLLAAFVLFNFFSNSPFSPVQSPIPLQTHEGTVLTHQTVGTAPSNVSNWPWLSFQLVNSVVSIFLLIYLLNDGNIKEKLCTPLKALGLVPKHRVVKNKEYYSTPRLGVWGLVKVAIIRCITNDNKSNNEGISKVWRPIAEAMVLNSSSPPLISAVQTYLSFSSVVTSPTQIADHITLALLSYTFSLSIAERRWANLQAATVKSGMNVSAYERLALSLDLDEAVRILGKAKEACFPNDTPVVKLARYVILESAKKLAVEEWLSCVATNDSNTLRLDKYDAEDYRNSASSQSINLLQRALVFQAGQQLGGKVGELVSMLKQCHFPSQETEREVEVFEESDEQESRSSISSSEELSVVSHRQESQSEELENIRSMLLATVLYKQIFPQNSNADERELVSVSSLSDILALRRTLASAAFDYSPETEDARDRVVDILVEMSRTSKHNK